MLASEDPLFTLFFNSSALENEKVSGISNPKREANLFFLVLTLLITVLAFEVNYSSTSKSLFHSQGGR